MRLPMRSTSGDRRPSVTRSRTCHARERSTDARRARRPLRATSGGSSGNPRSLGACGASSEGGTSSAGALRSRAMGTCSFGSRTTRARPCREVRRDVGNPSIGDGDDGSGPMEALPRHRVPQRARVRGRGLPARVRDRGSRHLRVGASRHPLARPMSDLREHAASTARAQGRREHARRRDINRFSAA